MIKKKCPHCSSFINVPESFSYGACPKCHNPIARREAWSADNGFKLVIPSSEVPDKIISYTRTHPNTSVSVMANDLKLSTGGARHIINQLIEEGVLSEHISNGRIFVEVLE